jgi:hypothetical protein
VVDESHRVCSAHNINGQEIFELLEKEEIVKISWPFFFLTTSPRQGVD